MILEVLEGKDAGKRYVMPEAKEWIIGRDASAEINLDDAKISRHHAKIYFKDGKPYLADLQSTNGTRLNGEFITRTLLSENDEIIVGDTLFLVKGVGLHRVDPPDAATVLHFQDDASPVILRSLPQMDADLLRGKGKADALHDLLVENTLLRKVSEICQWAAAGQDVATVMSATLATLREMLQADTVCVLMRPNEDDEWSICYTPDPSIAPGAVRISRTIIAQALSEGMAILTSDPLSDQRFDPSVSIIAEGISSAICSPLKVGDHYLGVLFIDRRNRREVFQEMDLRFAATISNLLGLLLEKEQLEEASRRKERLAVIGEVIAGLAHHTKNIITGLKFSVSALEIVLKKGQADSVEKCIRSINMQERRISDLVLNMLSLSKDRVPVRSRFAIEGMLRDMLEPYDHHLQEKNIRLQLQVAPEIPEIDAEEAGLHRVFLNLLVNALDSFKHKAPTEGEVLEITITVTADRNRLQVEFYDTGCGISREKLERIFTVFYSTKGSEGTGLGLAVAHKLVLEHGGTIAVESKEREWTRFTVTLPLSPANGESASHE